MGDKAYYNYQELVLFSEQLLYCSGVKKGDAQIVTDVLLTADLEGVSSHGITRLPIYLERLHKGLINNSPNITVKFPFPALGVLDADNGLGHIAGFKAMEEAILKAESFGISAVGVKNSNHFGTASYYAQMAVKKGLIGIVIANGPPAIPPYGAREPYFGTNPLAISIPGGRKQGPISIDLATSIVARGKIIKAAQENSPISANWALDEEGRPTIDAKAALKGCILPMGAHKGAALAMAIEILAGLLTGAGFGKGVIWQYSDSPEPSNVGNLFIALNPKGFMSEDEFKSKMDEVISDMKDLAKAQGFTEIRIPGENRRLLAGTNKVRGIALSKELVERLEAFSIKFNVEMPKLVTGD